MNIGSIEDYPIEDGVRLLAELLNQREFTKFDLLIMNNKYEPSVVSQILDRVTYDDPFLGYFLLCNCEPFPKNPVGLNENLARAVTDFWKQNN